MIPLSLFLVRLVDVAVAAHAFGVNWSIFMDAIRSFTCFVDPTIGVVALIAHTFGVVLGVWVRTRPRLLATFLGALSLGLLFVDVTLKVNFALKAIGRLALTQLGIIILLNLLLNQSQALSPLWSFNYLLFGRILRDRIYS